VAEAVVSWTLIAHAHSRHSYDALTAPAVLVDRAVALGAHVLAITDHDTWRGSVEAAEYASRRGLALHVIPGAEVFTDQGDVIGLFLRQEPTERRALAFVDAVHADGGLVVLPHPCRFRDPGPELLARVDLVETFNARTPRAANARARALAEGAGKPVLAAPDAHRAQELGLARVVFEGEPPADEAALKIALLTAPRAFVARGGSIWDEWRSQAVKCARRGDLALAAHLVRGAVRRVLKPDAYRAE
jgi:predicted metal-dependent phosphoesterase TrpH